MDETRVKTISPMLAVADVDAAISFYRDVLGFVPVMASPLYAVLARDGQRIHLQRAESAEVLNAVRGHVEIYIEVDNIHALWERVGRLRDRFRMRDLFERSYGMTEFHIEDPDGCLIFVGEQTAK
jgi:catechol 2,3-dioxygenase-like lactoylglutathione lyase family enzyme